MMPIPEAVVPDETGQGVDWTPVIAATIDAGVAALQGEHGPTYDALVYTSAIILHHMRRVKSIEQGARLVGNVLDSGHALNRFC